MKKHYHLIGICGSAMASLAGILKAQEYHGRPKSITGDFGLALPAANISSFAKIEELQASFSGSPFADRTLAGARVEDNREGVEADPF